MPGFISIERLTLGGWEALERNIARLFEHQGFNLVFHVGGTGDKGGDIVGSINGENWVIQSKFKSSVNVNKDEAAEPVSAMFHYNAQKAVIATNKSFTKQVYQYQKSLKDTAKVHLETFDGSDLLSLYNDLNKYSHNRKELRDYQHQAVQEIENVKSIGVNQAHIVMATGLGKSLVIYETIVNHIHRHPNQEILVLVHRNAIVKQLERGSWSQLPKDVSTHVWSEGEEPKYKGGVTFATFQSVINAQENLQGKYPLVIVDEAHNANAPTYKKLLKDLDPKFLLGATATPWRGDGQLIKNLFGNCVFSMGIVKGMQLGYLAEVDYRMITDDIDWNYVMELSDQGYSINQLNSKLHLPERDISIVDKVNDHFKNLTKPRVLVFCKSISHAEKINKLFISLNIKTSVYHSDLHKSEKFKILSDFRSGKLDILVSVDMLNEGIDVPDVNMVVFCSNFFLMSLL